MKYLLAIGGVLLGLAGAAVVVNTVMSGASAKTVFQQIAFGLDALFGIGLGVIGMIAFSASCIMETIEAAAKQREKGEN